MISHEAKSSVLFRHWLRANPQMTCTFEMKDTHGKDYLNFGEVKQEQIDWGMAIKSKKGVLMRMQAVAEGQPDYAYFRNEPAFVVIKYPKSFEMIDIETFTMERDRSKKKSLTSERARAISIISIPIK